MAENWESWLRGDSAGRERADERDGHRINEDVAALLGLPLALARRATEELPEEPSEMVKGETPPPEEEVPPTPEAEEEGEPALLEVPIEIETTESEIPSHLTTKEAPVEDPEVLPDSIYPQSLALPSLERVKAPVGTSKRAKALTLGSATAAIALGAYLFFTREATEDLILKGGEHSRGGDYSQALEYYHRAAEKDPEAFSALLGIADALERLGRKGEAVDAYYRCLQANPSDPQIHKRLAFLLLSMGSYDNALRSFHDSVNLNPSDGEVYSGLGSAYEAKGDFVQAVSAFRRAMDLDPDSKEYEESLKRAEGKLSSSVEEAERQERILLAEEEVGLGQAALEEGDLEGAREFFLKAAALRPGDPNALLGLGDVNKLSGNLEAAAGYYQVVLELHPDSLRAKIALEEVDSLMTVLLAEKTTREDDPSEEDGKKDFPPSEETGEGGGESQEERLPGGQQPEVKGSGETKAKEQISREGEAGKAPFKEVEGKGDTVAEKPGPKIPSDKPAEQELPAKGDEKPVPSPVLTGKGTVRKVTPLGFAPQRKVEPSPKASETGAPVQKAVSLTPRKPKVPVKQKGTVKSAPDGAVKSLEQFEKGNYSLAFSHLWDKMITSAENTHALAAGERRLYGGSPFAEGRWRDIVPVEKGPLGGGISSSVPLPALGAGVSSRGVKGILLEAVALNKAEETVYLNLYTSYILQRKGSGGLRAEEEEALCYSLLAHAWLKKGEKEKAIVCLNAAKRRAPRDLFDHLLPLEELFFDERGG